ncbi:hypothetical protein D3C79_930460 [compost metagenome]
MKDEQVALNPRKHLMSPVYKLQAIHHDYKNQLDVQLLKVAHQNDHNLTIGFSIATLISRSPVEPHPRYHKHVISTNCFVRFPVYHYQRKHFVMIQNLY